jgi:hypothetical protein
MRGGMKWWNEAAGSQRGGPKRSCLQSCHSTKSR